MNLDDYKLIFVTVALIGILLIASPAIVSILRSPVDEPFSQLYLLDSQHQAKDYPYNIDADQPYSVYIGLENHMGASEYYVLYLKLRNQTDSAPNDTLDTPSTLEPLYEYDFMVPDGNTWETLLTLSVSNAVASQDQSSIGSISFNGVPITVNKPAIWTNGTVFSYQLLFELWAYNTQSGLVEYNNRHVDLQFNVTKTST